MINELKPKEKLFCYYYAKLRNSKEASIKAGYSRLTAEIQGDRLLMDDTILKVVSEFSRCKENTELLGCVEAGLKRLAFATTNDSVKLMFCDRESANEMLEGLDLFHVAEIKSPKENCVEIKFFDRFKAFDKLIELAMKSENENEACEFYKALESRAADVSEDIDEI